MGNYVDIFQFYLLNEIWLYNVTNQVYLITLLMVFSLVAYLFVKNRSGESFVLSSSEQYHFLNTITKYSETADIILDNDHIIRFANEKFLDLFDLTQEIDNQPFSDIPFPADLSAKINSMEIGGQKVNVELSGKNYQLNVAPVTTHDGQLLGKLIKVKDLSLDQNRDNVTSKWMHELNTPLNAIMGYSELLTDEDNLTDNQIEYLHVIAEHSHMLKDRIQKLLADNDINGLYRDSKKAHRKIERILIVDDVTINRTLLKIILNRYGYEVMEAENGKEALESINKQACDLILMDLSMPIMDGVEATENIRLLNSSQSEVPIIAVTASSKYKNTFSLKNKGFDALLKKPFKENELIGMLNHFEFN